MALAGPGPVDVENDTYRVHNPLDITDIGPTPILLAALAPVMLRLAGEQADGTMLWMADERAIGDHVVPRITKAAAEAGRPAAADRRGRAGQRVPRTKRSTTSARGPTVCWATRNTAPTTSACWSRATSADEGEFTMRPATRRRSSRGLKRYRDAGVTDFSVRTIAYRQGPGVADRVRAPDRGVSGVAQSRSLEPDRRDRECNCTTPPCSSGTPTQHCASTATDSGSRCSSTASSTATGRHCSGCTGDPAARDHPRRSGQPAGRPGRAGDLRRTGSGWPAAVTPPATGTVLLSFQVDLDDVLPGAGKARRHRPADAPPCSNGYRRRQRCATRTGSWSS